jgi:hypothetical protein
MRGWQGHDSTTVPWLIGTVSRLVTDHATESDVALPVGAQVEVLHGLGGCCLHYLHFVIKSENWSSED